MWLAMQASERACQWAVDYVLRPGKPDDPRCFEIHLACMTPSNVLTRLTLQPRGGTKSK
jgi:hypothetical protein